jgi:hypothetical protein
MMIILWDLMLSDWSMRNIYFYESLKFLNTVLIVCWSVDCVLFLFFCWRFQNWFNYLWCEVIGELTAYSLLWWWSFYSNFWHKSFLKCFSLWTTRVKVMLIKFGCNACTTQTMTIYVRYLYICFDIARRGYLWDFSAALFIIE